MAFGVGSVRKRWALRRARTSSSSDWPAWAAGFEIAGGDGGGDHLPQPLARLQAQRNQFVRYQPVALFAQRDQLAEIGAIAVQLLDHAVEVAAAAGILGGVANGAQPLAQRLQLRPDRLDQGVVAGKGVVDRVAAHVRHRAVDIGEAQRIVGNRRVAGEAPFHRRQRPDAQRGHQDKEGENQQEAHLDAGAHLETAGEAGVLHGQMPWSAVRIERDTPGRVVGRWFPVRCQNVGKCAKGLPEPRQNRANVVTGPL